MKQVAKKTVGVAALGAAVVMAGAGAASAAPTDALGASGGQALGPVTETAGQTLGNLPLKQAAQVLPGGLSEPVGVAQEALTGALTGTPLDVAEPVADSARKSTAGKSSAPGGGMLGGLPLGKALPVGGSH
ncbi:hypothetical protein FM076_21230 [Streptomyces albus subsp. chlorinus]|uniref:hypothetical protein n=1 Tax=Streptomyces albus TaxID=1888 RepID=UPI00156DA93B|nr:hypothetical protein [Streptomyces albus]NSC23537.1 hypothetical protein [Streptomyces albus subsp. chlorinus]